MTPQDEKRIREVLTVTGTPITPMDDYYRMLKEIDTLRSHVTTLKQQLQSAEELLQRAQLALYNGFEPDNQCQVYNDIAAYLPEREHSSGKVTKPAILFPNGKPV